MIPRRQLLAPLAGLAVLTLLAWAYIASLARGMDGMAAMAMPDPAPWGLAKFGWAVAMWGVMMIAMMTPSAAPMILAHHGLRRSAQARPAPATAAFVAGYLLVWLGFSLGAATLQLGLQRAGALSGDAMRAAPAAAGVLLVVAGAWQLTPARDACLTKCRSPLAFLMTAWRDGTGGALRMGLEHGAWCAGCCWALMLVLFAAGIMNLAWIAALAGWVLLEKTLPGARWLARAGGVLALAWGAWLLAGWWLAAS